MESIKSNIYHKQNIITVAIIISITVTYAKIKNNFPFLFQFF